MLFYSPKSHIEQLWKEIFDFTRKLEKFDEYMFSFSLQHAIRERRTLINALLDLYFDLEEDAEYISGNRPDQVDFELEMIKNEEKEADKKK